MDKKKMLTYGLSIVLPMICLAFVLIFAVAPGTAYVVAYEILALEVCYLVVGTIWHGVQRTMAVKVIASKVWFCFLVAATIWIIISESWSLVTLLVGVGLLGLVNWAGFRYVVTEGTGVVESFKEDKVEKLATTMLYKLGEDGKPNAEEPLCIVEGVAVTPARALEKGYVDVAEAAIAYIKTII